MKKQYSVYKDGAVFGTAQMQWQGLYCHIRVLCPEPVRVRLTGELGIRELGLCVPVDGGYGIDTRIPAKHLGNGTFAFCAAERKGAFYPLVPGMPFPHLDKLRKAVLVQTQQGSGIQTDSSSPTGQWSEPITSE